MLIKYFIITSLILISLIGCGSSTTIYKIETTEGNRYYSKDKPVLNKEEKRYKLEDLDGNRHYIDSSTIYKVEPFERKL